MLVHTVCLAAPHPARGSVYSGKEEDSPELRELTRARQRKGMRGRATFRFYQLVQVCRSVEKTYWFSLLVFACIPV